MLLVALAVLFLVWARAQRKGFHLPGGDGVVIVARRRLGRAAAAVWRLFDKPDSHERAGHGRHPVGDVRRA